VRFCKEPIGFMADIKSMFHQVRMDQSHVDYLRFLWWPQGDTSRPPKEYCMLVHIFGAVSSPSCAIFALQKTADDNEHGFPPQVAETVRSNFYVDDCVKSVAKETEAIQLVKDLTALCRKGGFQLTQWVSNIRAGPPSPQSKGQRMLGLWISTKTVSLLKEHWVCSGVWTLTISSLTSISIRSHIHEEEYFQL